MLHIVFWIALSDWISTKVGLYSRHGPVIPQNAARSQKAITATAHSCHGMSSRTRRMSLMSTNVLDDRELVDVESLVECQRRDCKHSNHDILAAGRDVWR